jgi:hypothetical protein
MTALSSLAQLAQPPVTPSQRRTLVDININLAQHPRETICLSL